MRQAFKEWAVVCRALAKGRQTVVLRKGGIVEDGGRFRPEHPEFLLFPTFVHQSPDGLAPEARGLFDEIASPQSADVVPIAHYATVECAVAVDSVDVLGALRDEHVWSDAVVEERFRRWRDNGLHALLVRVHALRDTSRIPMRDAYGGCKSWVTLDDEVDIAGSVPVLDDASFLPRAEKVKQSLQSVR